MAIQIFAVRALLGSSSGRSTPGLTSIGQKWQFHIGRSSGRSASRSTPHRSSSEWQFQIFIVRALLGRSTPLDLPVNGNFRFLLYKLFLADQVADLPPGTDIYWSKWQFHIGRSSGRSVSRSTPHRSASEWQFQIFTVWALLGSSSGRSTPPLRSASASEWQFHLSTVRTKQ